ncbi:MAG: AraC family transcriptional regulator [Rhodothermales bacterium]|nr:AraC family transcriptional regulator [Rhodothermales bacterium]
MAVRASPLELRHVELALPAGAGYRAWVTTYPPGMEMAAHAHACPSVSVVLAGALTEDVGRVREQATALSAVVKPAGVRHRNRFGGSGARLLGIVFADAFVEGLDDAAPAAWRWTHAGPVAPAVVRLWTAARSASGDADTLGALDAALGDVLAPAEPEEHRSPPRWLLDVRDRLHDEYACPPPVTALAASAGVHRVHLARRFRRHFGCSTTAYLRRLRVRAAAAALATTDEPLAAVALDAGFSDQPHLSRAFKAATGTTPAAFRALVQA